MGLGFRGLGFGGFRAFCGFASQAQSDVQVPVNSTSSCPCPSRQLKPPDPLKTIVAFCEGVPGYIGLRPKPYKTYKPYKP